MKVTQRYFLTRNQEPEREVSLAEYLYAQAVGMNEPVATPRAFSTQGYVGRIKTDIEE
jgi:hypothetical protein